MADDGWYYLLWVTRNGQRMWDGPHRSAEAARAVQALGYRKRVVKELPEPHDTVKSGDGTPA